MGFGRSPLTGTTIKISAEDVRKYDQEKRELLASSSSSGSFSYSPYPTYSSAGSSAASPSASRGSGFKPSEFYPLGRSNR
ncbi:hypothetical protein POJ06DRAFT_270935 [Lipomyces tetrasporus]|uniref:Uncharacterized protein n=1 Tax=Lipomyces tetrasporus TaxID=54092 RepID=A0AAD7VQL3_9ASCO|nr:uncharacterized protein POJ06DRAFT_270935 [Lipomyces tetrasporus]KAJ8097285.1 hypothetical protein POJ06DRAFT_270935 [Lipomyces tetrasporus]